MHTVYQLFHTFFSNARRPAEGTPSNRRLSSNGIVKGFGFIGAGNRKLLARDGQELMPKFANLFAGSYERILHEARHVSKPNSTCSGSRWLNQQLPNIESKHLSLPPKRGRLSFPITPKTSSASISLQSLPRPSVTFTASSSYRMKDVKSFISTSRNIQSPRGQPSS